MSYSIANQPGARDAKLEWDERGPGLYDGEVLVALDDNFVAVSADAEWPENNNGLVLKGCARWCDKDGQTILSRETHVEVTCNHNFSAWHASNFALADLKKEVILLMLGEAPALLREEVPILDVSDDVRLHSSIRQAIACASSINEQASLVDSLTT